MDLINKFSKQRGRVIDFKEIFYGYHRVNPLFGVDYMLDMLLMYKKYRGKKMTVPVRRHAYLQRQFTGEKSFIAARRADVGFFQISLENIKYQIVIKKKKLN